MGYVLDGPYALSEVAAFTRDVPVSEIGHVMSRSGVRYARARLRGHSDIARVGG